MPAEEHATSLITYAVEKYLGPTIDSLVGAPYAQWLEGLVKGHPDLAHFMGLGTFVTPGHLAIPDHVVMATFVLLLLFVAIPILKRNLSIAKPSHGQQILELIIQALRSMLDDVVGPNSYRFMPIIGMFAVYIFTANIMGVIPGLTAPTSSINVTLGLGALSFLYYNFAGIREHGVKYVAHFFGPVAFLAPMMLIIELFSHVFRPVSLSIRLFGNMHGEHILGGVFVNQLVGYPFLIPVPVMALGLFTVLLQTYIFIMLSMVYISGAVAHEH